MCVLSFPGVKGKAPPVPPELCLSSSFGESLCFFQARVQSFLAAASTSSLASFCLQ